MHICAYVDIAGSASGAGLGPGPGFRIRTTLVSGVLRATV